MIFDCEKPADLADTVARGAADLGIALPPGALTAFEKYYTFLGERGKEMNLTAINGRDDVARLHFLDSLALLGATSFKGAGVIDIGSGAGFPGVPLKIAEPSINLTLLDATGKRIKFLSELCAVLGIDAACVHARAEDAGREPDMRERYDIAVSRAVARMDVLCELCLPLVRVGGVFIAMKGFDSGEEIEGATDATKALGAKLREVYDYNIPGTGIVYRAVVISKALQTPEKYPRRFARIQKAPL